MVCLVLMFFGLNNWPYEFYIINAGIAAGMESMTVNSSRLKGPVNPRVCSVYPKLLTCLL